MEPSVEGHSQHTAIWQGRMLGNKHINFRLEQVLLSHIRLFATPWKVAYQAPLSMGFSRQEYWSGLLFPSPGNLPNPGIEPRSPALQTDALPSESPGKPQPPVIPLQIPGAPLVKPHQKLIGTCFCCVHSSQPVGQGQCEENEGSCVCQGRRKTSVPPVCTMDFSGASDGKVSAYNAGDLDSIPGLGRSPGEGNGNPLQYSCLENPMDREAW